MSTTDYILYVPNDLVQYSNDRFRFYPPTSGCIYFDNTPPKRVTIYNTKTKNMMSFDYQYKENMSYSQMYRGYDLQYGVKYLQVFL